MTCFPLQFFPLARTSIRRSAAPVRSGPPLETAIAPPRGPRKDRQRRRQSSLSVMNEGDQACPETRLGPHPSPGDRRPARTLAGIADGMDVLLGSVEFQHRHAAQLNTHANAYLERLIGSIRRECLDHVIVLNETGLRRVLKSYFAYYEQSRPHFVAGQGRTNQSTDSASSHGSGRANSSSWRTASSLRTFCRLNKRDSSHIVDGEMSFGCFFVSSNARIGSRRTQPARTIGGTSTSPNEFERTFWYGQNAKAIC
jgi:hypothetical protein